MNKNKILFLFGFLIFSNCSNDKVQREVTYYKNGQLNHEVLLKNGKPEGLGIIYYESGKVQSKTYWKDGKIDGKKVFFYENGNLRQVSDYKAGICLRSEDYTKEGVLEEIRVYDSLGRIFDYYVYNKDGTRNFSRDAKYPIFITDKDTINLGEHYIAEIRLGNRQFSHVDVHLGDFSDPHILKKNPRLPKKDSLTSILNIKADSIGRRKISGVVFERNEKWDSLEVVPFTHYFYVNRN